MEYYDGTGSLLARIEIKFYVDGIVRNYTVQQLDQWGDEIDQIEGAIDDLLTIGNLAERLKDAPLTVKVGT